MAAGKEELIEKLYECVVEMEDEDVVDVCNEYLEAGYNAYDGIMEGLVAGMNKASELYDEEEYFVTDVLLCSDALYAGLEVLRPHLEASDVDGEAKKVVIGVVEGDTHDIGKNLVKIMLEGGGFEVVDLGVDVSAEKFLDTAEQEHCDIIACSALLTTTMSEMRRVVELATQRGIREKHRIIIGGAPITQQFCDEIGADGYSPDAAQCVSLASRLMEQVSSA